MDANNQEIWSSLGTQEAEAEEVQDLRESLRGYFAEQARESQRRDREYSSKQRAHKERRAAFKARLREEAEKVIRTQEQKGESVKDG